MRKIIISLLAVSMMLVPLMAGEYQAESRAFEAAFAAGDYVKAAEIATTPVGKGNALNMQAYAAWDKGDFAKAKELCLAAIASDPEQFWAHNTLGACLMKELDFKGAIAEFTKSIEVNEAASDADAEARAAKARANLETAKKLRNK